MTIQRSKRAWFVLFFLITAIGLCACGKAVVLNNPAAAQNARSTDTNGSPNIDKAVWQSQNPEDGVHVEAGSEFDITWHMLNSGTTTWTTDYSMRYFAATDLTKPGKDRYNLSEPVPPGAVGNCSVDAIAPWEPGTYQMFVVLSNGNDENFAKVDIIVNVDETELSR